MKVSSLRFAATLSLILLASLRLPAVELTVGAAISLSDAVEEITNAYTAETGVVIRNTFAGTNVIARQIEAGAPIDIFISADTATMDAMVEKGLVEKSTLRIIARNELVVILPTDSKLALESARDLINLNRIALADPQSVPAGIYAKKWLQAENLWPDLEKNLIPLENVRAALIAAETGNVQAAITYRSDAASSKKVKIAFSVPLDKTGPIEYPAAAVKASKTPEQAQLFVQFLTDKETQAILFRHGFKQ